MSHRASSSKPGDVLDLEIGSDDDDFLGEVKTWAASAKPAAPHLCATSPSAACVVPSVTVPSEPFSASQLKDAASTSGASSPEQQAGGEGGTDPAECQDLRDKLNRIRCHRRRKPKRRGARRNADLRAQLRDVADEGPSSFARRRAAFLSDGKAGKARRRNVPFGISRRLRTYVDLDRPTEEFGNDDECLGEFPPPRYRRDFFRPGNSRASAVGELDGQREAQLERRN
ncbi:hypothetical protein MTO96_031723 [Rhipicephalus appendiculatus]